MDLIFWKFGVSRAVPAPPGLQQALVPCIRGIEKWFFHDSSGVWS